jgi:hypothetical protein
VKTAPEDPTAVDEAPEVVEQRSENARTRPSLNELIERARRNWQAVSALVVLSLGIIFVMLGWWGAAHTNVFTEQIPYLIPGGLLGLGLIIVAGLMVNNLSNERSMRALRRELQDALGAARNGQAPANGSKPAARAAHVMIVKGGRAYHYEGCPIAEGKEGAREITLREAIEAGYASCKLCGSS